MRGFWFSLGEGLRGFRRAKLSAVLCLGIMTAALTAVGLFLSLVVHVHWLLDTARSKVDVLVVVDEIADDERVRAIEAALTSLEGVATVRHTSKAQAAQEFQRDYGEDILELLGHNPLPRTFTVTIAPAYRMEPDVTALLTAIEALAGVESITYNRTLAALLNRYYRLALGLLLATGLLVAGGAVLVISNTIKLTMQQRQDVLRVLSYVGATRAFIRRPFLLEGLLQGIAASLLSMGVIWLVLQGLSLALGEPVAASPGVFGALAAVGALLGLVGSGRAVRRFLP